MEAERRVEEAAKPFMREPRVQIALKKATQGQARLWYLET